jgi:hypothetical protein
VDNLRPEARGPLKSRAWGGHPTCHPQTLPVTLGYRGTLYIGAALACTVISFQIVVPSSCEVKCAQLLCHSWSILMFLGRMLPVLTLVVPTVMFGLLRYLFSIMVRGMASHIMRFSHRHEQEKQVRFITLHYNITLSHYIITSHYVTTLHYQITL